MQVRFRNSVNVGVSRVGYYDSMCVWNFGHMYDDAKAIFGGIAEYEKTLEKMKAIDDEEFCFECIAVYKSDSKLRPVFCSPANRFGAMADLVDDCTASMPDVVYLMCYDDKRCKELFNKALDTNYLDFKDFDIAMKVYSDIPETKGVHVKAVLLDLSK